MLTFKKIGKKSCDSEEIKKIFVEAFPPDERPPYLLIAHRAAKSQAVEFDGIYDDDRLIGLAYIVSGGDIVYLLFLALRKEERGRGYGTRIMALLLDRFKGRRFFLALERPDEEADNREQRLSRHRFYERCGLKDLPYLIKEGPLTYAVMGTGGDIFPDEYRALMKSYLGIFRYLIKMDMIRK